MKKLGLVILSSIAYLTTTILPPTIVNARQLPSGEGRRQEVYPQLLGAGGRRLSYRSETESLASLLVESQPMGQSLQRRTRLGDNPHLLASLGSTLNKYRDFDSASAYMPNWMNISLENMSGAQEAGNLGNRSWNVGDTPAKILTLGDLDDSLMPQKFQVGQILNITKGRSSNISLNSFPIVGKQTLKELVDAVPSLGNYLPEEVAPIANLLNSKGLLYSWGTENYLTLSQIVRDPIIGNLKLKEINLGGFNLDSIPNLNAAVLENFEGWENSFILEIPGLGRVPLGLMPNPLSPDGSVVARIDRTSGKAESFRSRTISGSNRVGFNYPCDRDCAHIELDDLENIGDSISQSMEGVQWISGKYQKVKGGSGCLKGSEPTGRHPFGRAFKVVVWNPRETPDSVDTMMFFRFKLFCGKSPYVIGPFPFFSYKINDLIFLGSVDPSAIAPNSLPAINRSTAPLKVFQPVHQAPLGRETGQSPYEDKGAGGRGENSLNPHPLASNRRERYAPPFKTIAQGGVRCGASCANPHGELPPAPLPLDLKTGGGAQRLDTKLEETSVGGGLKDPPFVFDSKKLAAAIASVSEGKFDPIFVGTYVCKNGLNCGRSLGKYQFKSSDPIVGEIVGKIPGGKEWLDGIAKRKLYDDLELKKFFSIETQEQIHGAIVSALIQQTLAEIDPQSNAPFTGERLIERVAQKFFGGIASRIDSPIGKLSGINPANYGVEILKIYRTIADNS
jgi:hypothetical protein